MKNLLKSVIAAAAILIGCFATSAQTVGVAVLTHGDEVKMFYGNSALHQAVDAATEGDVISLSPGVFDGYVCHGGTHNPLTKSGLTIIGSGMQEDSTGTILTDLHMIAEDNPEKFIELTLKDVIISHCLSADHGNYKLSISKCLVKQGGFHCGISEDETSTIELNDCVTGNNSSFNNCILNAYNCVFHNPSLEGDVSRSRVLSNCILLGTPTANSSASITNCIIIDGGQYCQMPTSVRVTNCKAIVNAEFKDYFGDQNYLNERLPKDYDAFIEGSFYELKPELTSTWVDERGDQVGIYGGPMPFSMLPDAPRFTKFNVPARTDAEGKLPVEIEVALPEK